MKIEKAIKLFSELTTYYIEKKDVENILTEIYSDFETEVNELKREVFGLESELANEQYGASI